MPVPACNAGRWDNWVDVDEKWFYVVSLKGFVWFLPDYMDLSAVQLPVQSKRYIQKIMFLCAVAKPIYDKSGACVFDGKAHTTPTRARARVCVCGGGGVVLLRRMRARACLGGCCARVLVVRALHVPVWVCVCGLSPCLQVGIWRCGEIRKYKGDYRGKRKSHRKGDPYFKDLSVDAELYVKLLRTFLLPRMAELRRTVWDRFNGGSNYDLHIQHDGAPGHKAAGVEELLCRVFSPVRGVFVRQPAKSPCTNMLDMAVFHSLSSIVAQNDYVCKEQLHVAVEAAFKQLPPQTLEMQWACKVGGSACSAILVSLPTLVLMHLHSARPGGSITGFVHGR